MKRRNFVLSSLGGALAATVSGSPGVQAARSKQAPHILLRSSWQTMNIGDIAHTPGVLRLLETHLPQADVTLWPSSVDNGVDRRLRDRFPKLKIVQDSDSRDSALKNCDFLLHGSGPSLVAERFVDRWVSETDKPYGIYGITLPTRQFTSNADEPAEAMAHTIELLSGAKFVFFRESKSLAFAKSLGCECPVMEFGPDGAFACDLRDDGRALKFLFDHKLEAGKFLCCIPRYRYTPNWLVPEKNRPIDPVRHARNDEMKEHDHAPLRQAITRVVTETDLKVLICPEDKTQMKIGKEMLLDRLPDDVRDRVVWRPNYWLTDEALSTYVHSAGLFGNEMHSPIMCIGHGIPAVVCRFAEQTNKGFMWEDIGLRDWLFDLDDEAQVANVVPTVLDIATDSEAARAKADTARKIVEQRQLETMAVVANSIS